MRDHRDKTMEEALGSVTREWRQMARLALTLRTKNNNPSWVTEKEKMFKGIYRRLLEDPIDSVRQEARR